MSTEFQFPAATPEDAEETELEQLAHPDNLVIVIGGDSDLSSVHTNSTSRSCTPVNSTQRVSNPLVKSDASQPQSPTIPDAVSSGEESQTEEATKKRNDEGEVPSPSKSPIDDEKSPEAPVPVLKPKQTFRQRVQSVARRMSRVLHIPDGGHTRLERLVEVLQKQSEKLPDDSVFLRVWNLFIVLWISYGYVLFTMALMGYNTTSRGQIAARAVMVAFYIVDVVIRTLAVRNPDTKLHTAVHIISALPLEFLLFIGEDGRVFHSFITAARSLKLFGVRKLFRPGNPQCIDCDYVSYYFRLLPIVRFCFGSLWVLHTCAVVKSLISEGHEKDYFSSLFWVWMAVTGSSVEIDLQNTLQFWYVGLMMLFSLVLQGYVVGTMSLMIFSFNVQDQNRQQMLISRELISHYKLPINLQHELLSYQYYMLEHAGTSRVYGAALDVLPDTMLTQITLYIKMNVLGNVGMFQGASASCKEMVAGMLQQEVCNPDTNIITAGDVGQSMYFMMHGFADVVLPNGLTVNAISRGDFFGEIALLSEDCTRQATIRSLSYCDLLVLHKDDFENVMDRFPELVQKVEERQLAMGIPVGRFKRKLSAADKKQNAEKGGSSDRPSKRNGNDGEEKKKEPTLKSPTPRMLQKPSGGSEAMHKAMSAASNGTDCSNPLLTIVEPGALSSQHSSGQSHQQMIQGAGPLAMSMTAGPMMDAALDARLHRIEQLCTMMMKRLDEDGASSMSDTPVPNPMAMLGVRHNSMMGNQMMRRRASRRLDHLFSKKTSNHAAAEWANNL